MIRRMTVLPMEGKEALQALISDGTGEVTIVFMGRRGIGGLSLGKRVVVEGVLGEQRREIRMVNPTARVRRLSGDVRGRWRDRALPACRSRARRRPSSCP